MQKTDQNIHDFIIIGSGFGGSVSAMRLSEKGYSVLVLEKGKKFETKDFPKTNWNIPKYFWAPIIRCFGFFQMTFFKEVFVMSGTGVGGGSLVYANTHLVPPSPYFNNPAWGAFKDWQNVLKPFYEKAKFMLGTTENKVFGIADEILKEVADEMGRAETYKPVNLGVYFGDEKKEKDPYFKGLGPERKACIECGGCMVGCRYNAKNSLDKNYLWFAQKFGTEIRAERKVTKIEYKDQLYHIHHQSSTNLFFKDKQVSHSKQLVMSAGVLGTMDLLLKQKYQLKTLTKLSNTLGNNIRTNSESICGVSSKKLQKMNHGVAISSVFSPDENTHVEVVKYSDGSNALKYFATLATGPGHPAIRTLKLLGNLVSRPLRTMKFYFGRKWAHRSVILLVMQTLDNSMNMVLKRFPFTRISISNNKENRVPAYIPIGQEVMNRYANKLGGIAQNSLMEVTMDISSTAHILGGCPMGKTEKDGIINDQFEVFGYPGMYILDGSVIQGNLGVNPSLTITALSEYAMARVPEKTGNKQQSLERLMASQNT